MDPYIDQDDGDECYTQFSFHLTDTESGSATNLVQDNLKALIVFSLLFLAGLGFVLKGKLQSEISPSFDESANHPVEGRQRSQRTLFQPLAFPTPLENTRAQSVTARVDKTKSTAPAKLVSPEELPATPPARKLLQGNQHKQRSTQFSKVGFDGQPLPDSALRWSCARDSKSGLLWETKLFDAGISDVEHRYSWYDPTRSTPGFKNRGSCYGISCDTHAYTEEMNRLGLCGSRNWRLPTFAELETLLDRDYFNPVINQEIFFNTRGTSYWSQSQLENNPEMIMQIDFFNGSSSPAPIHVKLAVRLVSD